MAPASVAGDLELPRALEASEPPEARGLRRDEVRLLVSDLARDTIAHAQFADLPRWLDQGDLLVVNTSATMNAALEAETAAGERFELHVSTELPGGFWTVELRTKGGGASLPYAHARAGTTLALPAGGRATLLAPYPFRQGERAASRLWLAALQVPEAVPAYLAAHGCPIRYGYVKQAWPASMYQTVFAQEPGSAEMPSAGRPFTPELVTRLVSRGVQIAPLVLHTGVASLETHEPPYEEWYRVPRSTASIVNAARRAGARVIAVGTTVVRALETVTDESGETSAGEGWTRVVIGPDRPVRSVTGLITGLHEPRATHLLLVEQVAAATSARARDQLDRAYAEARRAGYLWHEFGDAHLIV
jgi:S-adenosylmethionine:tRNA ribosyltransferase-isomerase